MKKILIFLFLFFSVLPDQAQRFYGITKYGGNYNNGTIYSTDSLGNNFQSLYSFKIDIPGVPNPSALCYVPATGKYYSCAYSLLYEWDYPTNTFINKVTFNGINAGSAIGSLLLAANGKIYGLTSTGGVNDDGVLFEFDPTTSVFSKKIDFDGIYAQNPSGGLIEDSGGNLLGMLQYGPGSTQGGCIVKYNIAGDSIVSYTYFNNSVTGEIPVGTLCKASNGSYYGICSGGGLNGLGTIFEYDSVNDTIVKHYDFTVSDGINPTGILTEFPGGKLYGFTNSGGSSGSGTVIEFNIATNVYTKKLDLDGYLMGGNPQSGFTFDAGSNRLYACTDYAGTGYGGIVEYNPVTNNLITKYVFPDIEGGSAPNAIPTILTGGIVLGTTGQGGIADGGTIFSYSIPSGVHTKYVEFLTALAGSLPEKGFTLAPNGKLYSVASSGGIYNKGVLYEFDISGNTYSKKYDFEETNGATPATPLLLASNGKLYGCTFAGGSNYSSGVFYEFDPLTSVYTKKHDFNLFSISDCGGFWDKLIEISGNIYGVGSVGGMNDGGAIFKYNISSGSMSLVHSFGAAFSVNGTAPHAGMAFNGSGKLISVTEAGGLYNYGAVYDFNIISNTYSKLFDINYTGPGSTGWSYSYAPIVHSDGNYYGATHMGLGFVGCLGYGSLYQFNPLTNAYTTIRFFDGWTGNTPDCTLLEGPSGALYGTTGADMINYSGVLFEFIPSTSTYTLKHMFNRADGAMPLSHLLYVDTSSIVLSANVNSEKENIRVYPNPAKDKLYIDNTDGNYSAEIFNTLGQKIKTVSTSSDNLNISDIPNGIYTLRLTLNNKTPFVTKVIIRH
jgi:hypothetical protein